MISAIYAQILPHLPPTLQDLLLNPPSLSSPSSFFPLFKAVIPYTQYIIVLVAFYIVYTTVRSIAGYFTRFIRFSLKLGPVIALVGWLMANSGQGGLEEVMQAVKEYTGLAQPAPGGARSPGVERLFGGKTTTGSRKAAGGSKWREPVSSRTRSAKGKTAGKSSGEDLLASVLKSATGGSANGQEEWSDVVKDYVKNAVAKAAGLEWLFGMNEGQQAGTGAGRNR